MSQDRRRSLRSLLLALVPAAALAGAASASPVSAGPASAIVTSAATEPDLLVRAQYYGERPRYRRRCHVERRRVIVRDRYGRPRERLVTREVCR